MTSDGIVAASPSACVLAGTIGGVLAVRGVSGLKGLVASAGCGLDVAGVRGVGLFLGAGSMGSSADGGGCFFVFGSSPEAAISLSRSAWADAKRDRVCSS